MNPSRVPAGSWTQSSLRLAGLPAALEGLLAAVDRQLQRSLQPDRREALVALQERLQGLKGLPGARETFEEALCACQECGYDRSESYLAFIYSTMRQPLTEFTSGLLRRSGSREDVEALAGDLVSALFAELAEAMMEDDDEAASTRLPPAGRALPWLFQAIRHDVMDHCKSGVNRLEQSVEPSMDEGYEQAVERLAYPLLPSEAEGGWSELDAAERREAFITAFEEATDSLKPRHREVLRLREVDNLSVDDIATHLDLTRQKVLDLLQYGREKRAQLMLARLKSFPVLADLRERPEEVTALLQRVRLWGLTHGLRPQPANGAPPGAWSAPQRTAWLPLAEARCERGVAHARGRRKL